MSPSHHQNHHGNCGNRYSSFPKLVRIISWLRRFITNCRTSTPSRITNQQLTSEEITKAKCLIIKSAQFQSYREAFETASNQRQLPKGHSLQHYDVGLNSQGLLEIQGRVKRGDGAPSLSSPQIKLNHHPVAHLITTSSTSSSWNINSFGNYLRAIPHPGFKESPQTPEP